MTELNLTDRAYVWHGVWYKLALFSTLFLSLRTIIDMVITPLGFVTLAIQSNYTQLTFTKDMLLFVPIFLAMIGEKCITLGLFHKDHDKHDLENLGVVFKRWVILALFMSTGIYGYFKYQLPYPWYELASHYVLAIAVIAFGLMLSGWLKSRR